MCNILWIVVCPFVLFLLALVLSVLLWWTDSDNSLVSYNSSCQHYRVDNCSCSPCIKTIIVYCNLQFINIEVVVVVIVWLLDLQLPVQSVPITRDVVSSNLDQGGVYNIM